ncbi:hypothetical protein GJ496_004292 [Pomphorhynchus laevis]|nr:hypothetical protein GJ496_004292 [Pomphorhynchus laevis]
MRKMFRIISTDNIGRDERTADNLLRKHRDVQNVIWAHSVQIDRLYQEVEQLVTNDDKIKEYVEQQVTSLQHMFNELLSACSLKQRMLEESIHLFRSFHDVDNIEAWFIDKQRLLYSLKIVATSDIEHLEVMKLRFNCFEKELYSRKTMLDLTNNLARQLVSKDHPVILQILNSLNNLNHKWEDLQTLADSKRDELQSTFRVKAFNIVCDENIGRMQEKVNIFQTNQDLNRDAQLI